MNKHLFLVGFMGGGKSTVGKLLSERLNAPFIDLDALIESRTGMAIPEIFALKGEPYFRDQETAALAAVVQGCSAVIATGGGIVGRADNWQCMRRFGVSVYLCADWETIKSRLGSGAGRPLANQSDGWQETRRLWQSRLPLYEQADYTVDTDGCSVADVAANIMNKVADAL